MTTVPHRSFGLAPFCPAKNKFTEEIKTSLSVNVQVFFLYNVEEEHLQIQHRSQTCPRGFVQVHVQTSNSPPTRLNI